MKWNNILIGLLLVCVGALLSTMLTRRTQIQQIEIVKTDTLVVARIDTITIEKPIPYKVVVKDTIYINDTINNYINGNIFIQEVKEYKDSTYYARVSGINAYLEEIRVYPKETIKYITKTEKVYQKPKKWGLGISAGYCFTDKFQPYIGVGITYNIIQW